MFRGFIPFLKYLLKSEDRAFVSSLHDVLGFYPRRSNTYKRAFIHKSVAKEIKKGFKESNERLEYLGDAVLDMVVSKYLYQKFPFEDEGFLTKMRSKIVSRDQLNDLAYKLDLDKFVQVFNNSKIKSASVYGNALEALIGAIYVDRGYQKANEFIINKMIKAHIDMEQLRTVETDHKSKLYEYAQQYKLSLEIEMTEKVASKNGIKSYKAVVVLAGEQIGAGEGSSKKKAQQRAAEIAFAKIGSRS